MSGMERSTDRSRSAKAVTSVNDWRSIFAASIMSGGGAMGFILFPMIIGESMDRLALDGEQAGLMFSTYLAGFMVICLTAVGWIRRVHWKAVAGSAFGAVAVGLVGAGLTATYPLMLASFFLSGCGAGTLYGLALCMIGDTRDPDRFFGVKIIGEQFVGAALLWVWPLTVLPVWGFKGLCLATAAVALLLGLTVFWVPRAGAKSAAGNSAQPGREPRSGPLLPVLFGLLALMLFFGGLTAVWAFVGRIADNQGISDVVIGRSLSVSVLGGGLGGLIAALVGDRYGRFMPLLVTALCTAVVYAIYNFAFGALTFAVATFFYATLWNWSLAYQFGIVSSADTGGRFTVLMSSALALGASAGSAIGGLLFRDGNYLPLTLVAISAIAAALLIFLWLLSWLRKYSG